MMQEVSTTSRVKRLTGKFTHSVVGWQAIPQLVGDHIESPLVELCGHKWKIRIFPGGSAMKHSNYVSLYLANRSSNAVSATYKLFIHNQETNEDEIIFTSAGVKLFDTQGQGRIDGWGRDRFIMKERLAAESPYRINDTVVFAVEITVYGDVEHYCNFVGEGSTLDQDMRSLLSSPSSSNSDIKIIIGGSREFPLHRCILSARSPVFKAMLSHPTLENTTGMISLEEEDPTVMEHFLNFLYTDYCSEKVLSEYARELLVVAAKFQVSLLSAICEHAIVSTMLDASTAISIHNFADIFGSPSMQSAVLQYISRNLEEVQWCSEYKELTEEQQQELSKRIKADCKLVRRKQAIEQRVAARAGRFSVCTIM
mmetsp:Transcript_23081/g.33804  ORF Transcript_23081/g.33804 Transcript_23081/m.33804 type:complete len:368 (+) Transcript_23081:142-1245(+)|eukprot:CAMPEP_0185037474 /NCGR_PEP_ID=MMETSP1103-20130426/31971_1 /TAXON_ID=36769 /ORGANISM="Paraphysomonas bandaiensis, Strain Caron Lab Isolate" /LENGTH=367 /DNA_ID=CAMNT_0027575467 /DNA_START=79 /DNA_END=1182 /DNA_ORIENTATION=-